MIYFIRHKKTGLIKIGKADYVANRVKQLEAQYGSFEIVGYLQGDEEVEKPLHSVFAPFQNTELLGGVEFFNPHPALMAYIEAVVLTDLLTGELIHVDFPSVPMLKTDKFKFVIRIGEFFEAAIEQHGFSLSALAGFVHSDPTVIRRHIERGRDAKQIHIPMIEAIQNSFDVPYWGLYTEKID
jgi:hypothetical protein